MDQMHPGVNAASETTEHRRPASTRSLSGRKRIALPGKTIARLPAVFTATIRIPQPRR
jgi:hypothetical protein